MIIVRVSLVPISESSTKRTESCQRVERVVVGGDCMLRVIVLGDSIVRRTDENDGSDALDRQRELDLTALEPERLYRCGRIV
eukprot:7117359-Pyramimonas_sp.AAC.1